MAHIILDILVGALTGGVSSFAFSRIVRLRDQRRAEEDAKAKKPSPVVYSIGQTVLVQPDTDSNFWFEGTIVEMDYHQYCVGKHKIFSVRVQPIRSGEPDKDWWTPIGRVRPSPEPVLEDRMPERQSPFRD